MTPDPAIRETVIAEQWIIAGGDHVTMPVGPFSSEEAAHEHYRQNQPSGLAYLAAPTIVRLLRPAVLAARLTEGEL